MNPVEADLDHFDPAVRRRALEHLAATESFPPPTDWHNLHAHTFFSYNAYGYSPSHFAYLARKRGLGLAGIVDFDVLDGVEEFHEAGRLLQLKTVASIESRVFVPELADRVINSPGEPGIAYHMGVGFVRALEHPLLTRMRRTAEQRNRDLLARVNTFTAPVTLDYDRDVLPLTPRGNATERHICVAYAARGSREFWRAKLGDCPEDPAALQALIRAKTMKQGGVGYVRPGPDTFPAMAEMNQFVREAGAIPTMTWLDGTSPGERDLNALFDVAIHHGAAALNIIPDRNYRPGVRDEKLQNLYDVVATAEKHGFPIIVGTEMNAPGNKFVDDFNTNELKPLVPVFLKGAFIVYAHTQLQRHTGHGYLSDWARKQFSTVHEKNAFFERLGRILPPNATAEDTRRAVQQLLAQTSSAHT
ncbi:MAG: hypothetical protein RMM51_11415 [Verrucomicrobiae bacterium]|nr:hypothetical protein [Verrucomicrobiae bacterium]